MKSIEQLKAIDNKYNLEIQRCNEALFRFMDKKNGRYTPEEVIEEALLGKSSEEQPKEKAYKVSVPQAAYTKYLEKVPKKEIGGIIEKALQMYFESIGQE